MNRFAIRISSLFAPAMLLIGVRSNSAHVALEEDELVVSYGLFHYRVPLPNIVSAERTDWPWYYGLGLRITPGFTVGCVASTEGVVRLTFAQPLLGKIAGALGIRYRAMALSLEQPQAFIDALNARTSAAAA